LLLLEVVGQKAQHKEKKDMTQEKKRGESIVTLHKLAFTFVQVCRDATHKIIIINTINHHHKNFLIISAPDQAKPNEGNIHLEIKLNINHHCLRNFKLA
jgi:hypothetical protein